MFNYPNVCKNLVKDLPPRARDVVVCRFGLETEKKETLEAIGQKYGITRERVRQIQEDGLKKASAQIKSNRSLYRKIFENFSDHLEKEGSLKREDKLLEQLGGGKYSNHVSFLLVLGDDFERVKGEQNFYSFWTTNHDSTSLVKKIGSFFNKRFKQEKKPLSIKEILAIYEREILPETKRELDASVLLSFLEVSKQISQAPNEQFGLDFWPEVNPKGVRDKAYLILKEEGRPLYFKEVTDLINSSKGIKGTVLPQTVHNELIRDSRFVLVGRGVYALREWGYEPGVVKDVILKILQNQGKPMPKEDIISKVLEQRQVKENTIVLNLQSRKYFSRNDQGEYFIKA